MKRVITLIFVLGVFHGYAAKLTGIVTDSRHQPLIGTTVQLVNNKQYTTSGLDGTFLFNKVSPGNYQLKITYVGFKTRLINVSIKNTEQKRKITVMLEESTTTLHEVSVTGQALSNSTAKALSRERKAQNIINAISGQTIRLSPDVSVSDVLQRVSGVSLEKKSGGSGGSYAIIRGMPKRYNYTLINGVKIPSPNNKNRYISMNIFPSDLLARLEVFKTLTPSMEGDAVGGVVNMVMKTAPDKFLLTTDISVGNHDIFFNHPFYYADTKYINPKSPFELHGYQYFAKPSDFTSKNMILHARSFLPDVRANVTIGNRYLNKRLGLIVSASFNNFYTGTNGLHFITGTTQNGTSAPVLDYMNKRFYYNHITQSGVYFATDYHLNNKNYFKFFTTYLYLNRNQVRDQIDYRLWGVDPNNLNVKTYNTRFRKTAQQIFNATLTGKHNLGQKTDIDWTVAYSKASQQRPDEAEFVRVSNYSQRPGEESILIAEDGDNYRKWQHNSDNNISGYLNLQYKFSGNSIEGFIKTGVFYRDKSRNSFIVTYHLNPDPSIQAYGTGWKPSDPNVTNYSTWENYADVTWRIQNPQGNTRDELNYDAYEQVGAAYVQLNLLYRKWEFIAGVRGRMAGQGYTLLAPRVGETPQQDNQYNDILPSVHVKYKINEQNNIRASWFSSVIMPGFFEIVPYIYAGEDYTELGNPDLKPIHAQNFDLRFSNYSSNLSHFSVGGFYKIIHDPIEYVLENGIDLGVTSIVRRPKNFSTATNYGLEIDYTRYFRNFGVKLNYTYTHSSVTTTKSLRVRENPNDPSSQIITKSVEQTRPLQGQADHIGNASLLYKGRNNGINAQVSAVYTGYRIQTISNFYNNDEWQLPYWTVDFAFNKKLKNGISLYLKVKNIFNNYYKVVIRQPLDAENAAYPHQGDVGTDFLTQKDLYGRAFRIGIQYKF